MWNKFCQLCQSYWVLNLKFSFSSLEKCILIFYSCLVWYQLVLAYNTEITAQHTFYPNKEHYSTSIMSIQVNFCSVFFYNAAYSAKSFVLSDEGLNHNPPHSTWIAEYLRLLSFYHKPNTTAMDLHPDTWLKCSGFQTATQSKFSPFISLYLSKFSSAQSWYSWKKPESNMGLYDTSWMHHFNR